MCRVIADDRIGPEPSRFATGGRAPPCSFKSFRGKRSTARDCDSSSSAGAVDVRPGAVGCLGATAGVTSLGGFVAVVRFEHEEAALESSRRREQSAWWEETSRFFEGGGPAVAREPSEVRRVREVGAVLHRER
jgi:hypothetical protein